MLSYALLSAALFIASSSAQGTPEELAPATYVASHNAARANWNADPLTAITDAAFLQSTQDWANACVFEHSEPNGAYGENLYAAGFRGFTPPVNFQQAMDSWMAESNNYCLTGVAGAGEPATGHFTQVVWQATTQVACAVASCPAGTVFADFDSYYYVCRYTPPGNVQGQYTNQVDTTNCAASTPSTPGDAIEVPAPGASAGARARARRSISKRSLVFGGQSDLFACGANAIDCSSIANASQVTCLSGKCVVGSCTTGSVSADGSSCA